MDDKFWAKIEFSLGEIRDLLGMQIESREDAVGKRMAPRDAKKHKNAVWKDGTPRWNDETNDDGGHDVAVRPWLLIPYVDAIDQDMLKERLETGKRLLTSVEQRIATRELSPELLHEWGLLCSCAGALEIVYHARMDVGRLREGGDNIHEQKRYFAHRFLNDFRKMKRGDALEKAEAEINRRYNELDPGADRDWFEKFLSKKASLSLENARRLTTAFSGLSKDDMEQLIKETEGPVPYFDGPFPDP